MSINRRKFIETGVLATAVAGGPSAILLAQGSESSSRVFAVLKSELKLGDGQQPLVQAFTKSLSESENHHRSAAFFQGKMALPGVDEELKAYVVQEFLVSTNFLAYASGHAPKLELIPTV